MRILIIALMSLSVSLIMLSVISSIHNIFTFGMLICAFLMIRGINKLLF